MQQNLETFEKTLNAARIFESVLIQGLNDRNNLSDELAVMKIQKHNKNVKSFHHKLLCSSCGPNDHPRSQCRFRHVTCHKFSVIYEQHHDIQPIHVVIKIDGFDVLFDLDTGSPITIINENLWIKMGKRRLKRIKSVYSID
ncbi:unnamed protein product [Rotaria sp. Silwood1]|nr:unnamed protein product [Rotaria sp. Silwood1]